MVANPYWTTGAIRDPERFVGRKELLEKLCAGLRNGQSFELVGARQIGKSSVLAVLQHQDIQRRHGFSPPPEMLFLNCHDLGDEVNEPRFWRCLCNCLGVPATYADPYEALQSALRSADRQIVFLLDEFDALNTPSAAPGFFNRLRSLAEGTCQFVFACRRRLSEWMPTDGVTSALFNLTLACWLEVLNPAETRQLIINPMGDATGLDEALVEPVVEAAGRHPYLVQALCAAVHGKPNVAIDDAILREVASQIGPNVLDWRSNLSDFEASLLGLVLTTGPEAARQEANSLVAAGLVRRGWLDPQELQLPTLLRKILLPQAPRPTVVPDDGIGQTTAAPPPLEEPTVPHIAPFPETFDLLPERTRNRSAFLRGSMEKSSGTLTALGERCHQAFSGAPDATHFTIGVCGSLARLEAGGASDLDAYVIFNNRNHPACYPEFSAFATRAREVFGQLRDILSGLPLSVSLHEFTQTEENRGTFPVAFRWTSLLEKIGTQEDSPELVTRRMCLLTESCAIYHPRLFEQVRREVLDEYAMGAVLAGRPPEDFIREFRGWCSAFQTREIAKSTQKQGNFRDINWVKLCHQRTLSHAALLWWFADLMDDVVSRDAVEMGITSPPLSKAIRLAVKHLSDERLPGLFCDLFECYGRTLSALSDPSLRMQMGDSGSQSRGLPLPGVGQVRHDLFENGTRVRRDALDILMELMAKLPDHDRRDLMGTLLL